MSVVNNTLKLLIADDHELVRGGLIAYLGRFPQCFEFLGEAKDGCMALMMCIDLRPDILILDLNMPGDMNGYEVIEEVRKLPFYTKIFVLTGTKFSKYQCLKLGADYWLDKTSTYSQILEALELLASTELDSSRPESTSAFPSTPLSSFDVMKGEFNSSKLMTATAAASVVTTTTTKTLTALDADVEQLTPSKPVQSGSLLSPKELSILSLFANGMKKTQVSVSLRITTGTLKMHLANIYKKLEVNSLTEAVLYALHNDLIKLDHPLHTGV